MTLEEAPITCRAWLGQRTRWLKGYAQTIAVHADAPAAVSVPLALSLGAALASALLRAPITLVCAGLTLFAAPAAPTVTGFLALLAGGYAASALCALSGLRRAGLRVAWHDVLTMPAYWPLQTLAAARALWELARCPHTWSKTEHGLSRLDDTA